MIDKRFLLILNFILPFILSAQSEKLLPMENYVIGQVNEKVYPRSGSIGILDERDGTNSILRKLFSNGPERDFCEEDMMNVLKMKYDTLTLISNIECKYFLSKIREDEGEYSGRFIVECHNYKIKGTIYLTSKGDKWFLYDFEAEFQEISNP